MVFHRVKPVSKSNMALHGVARLWRLAVASQPYSKQNFKIVISPSPNCGNPYNGSLVQLTDPRTARQDSGSSLVRVLPSGGNRFDA